MTNTRFFNLFILLGCAIPLTLPLPTALGEEVDLRARAKQIHEQVLAIDTHVDVISAKYATEELDPGIDNPELKCDLVKMARGNIGGVFLAVYTRQRQCTEENYRRALESTMARFDAIDRLAKEMYPDRCELALAAGDVRRIIRAGKRAIMIGVENGYPIGEELAVVEKLYERGARYITLCHNGHNQICDSCNPASSLGDKASKYGGLSPFGEQVVAEMNRLGMMIDVSHLAPSTFWDLIEVSRAPLIASHSGCRALNDHARNLDDAQLKALAKNGGVIQIVALGSFLRANSPERRRAINALAVSAGIPVVKQRPQWNEATDKQYEKLSEGMKEVNRQYPPAGLDAFLDHIDHAVKVAGIDHVGVGTDFDGGGGIPGFDDHGEALNVTRGLLERGYSECEIRKIWGENLLRVWQDVEKVARQTPPR